MVWGETRVSMGCRLEYEWERRQGLASFLSMVSVKPRSLARIIHESQTRSWDSLRDVL